MTARSDVYATVSNETQTLTMYSTPWCGFCRRLKAQLDRAGIPYAEIDITEDPGAALIVEKANRGNQTVPTVVLPDGRTFTNPTITEVTAALSASV